MLSLAQAKRKTAEAGEPIHSPFKGLTDAGIHIRRGQLTMVASGPGAGKSAVVHAMLHAGHKGQKNSTMFFQADTPSDIMWKRSAALATGYEQSAIERMEEADAVDSIATKIQKTEGHVTWSFENYLSLEKIWEHLSAYVEVHDTYPEVIVVDVLSKMVPQDDGDEMRALADACNDLVDLAKQTGAAVITLHHVSGFFEDSAQPIPLSGIRGKVGKSPSLILTLYKRSNEELRISVVKNRTGQADPNGGLNFGLTAHMGRMAFSG